MLNNNLSLEIPVLFFSHTVLFFPFLTDRANMLRKINNFIKYKKKNNEIQQNHLKQGSCYNDF